MGKTSLNIVAVKQDRMSSVMGEGKEGNTEQSMRVEWTEKGPLFPWVDKQEEMDDGGGKDCAHSQLK